jgi:hypothetical protein
VDFLYTSIGRGHAFYLDGIIESLPPAAVGDVADVLEVATGLSRMAWRLARLAYSHGAAGGAMTRLYSLLRRQGDYNRASPMLSLLGRDIRKRYLGGASPLVVAHPILAAILKDRPRLVYQHGEVAVPDEALVAGDHRIIVPTAAAADAFLRAGVDRERLFVSGLCIEPALVAQADAGYVARCERLRSGNPLTGAFFSSGAEPPAHVARLVEAACAAVRAGGRAMVFAQQGGRLARASERLCNKWVSLYTSRQELDSATAKLFMQFDYLVAPSHERTNWALGLGLPMFILDPPIGSFAPLNRQILLDQHVAIPLRDMANAGAFGETLKRLRDTGELERMASRGWHAFDINGFARIAAFLRETAEG